MIKRQLDRLALVTTGLGLLLIAAYFPSHSRSDGHSSPFSHASKHVPPS